MVSSYESIWLALVIGNSRLHWGCFAGSRWLGSWHTPHCSTAQMQALKANNFSAKTWEMLGFSTPLPQASKDWPPPQLWVASVVSTQLAGWRSYAFTHEVDIAKVPLQGLYNTFGIDRALTLLGAGHAYGWPVLVVDGGTALTFTAGEANHLIGGAILPGLGLQFKALNLYTDQLPQLQPDFETLPPRWARTTADAMASGIFYTQLAGIRDFMADWWQRFPAGPVIMTGGEASRLLAGLMQQDETLAQRVAVGQLKTDPNLMFWGLRACRAS